MFVRQLIGREAGTIIELPYHAATASLGMGTCAEVSDAEIAEAGLIPAPTYSAIRPDEMPAGYRAIPSEGGGFDVIDAGGVTVNKEFIPNLPAARSFALALAGDEMPAATSSDPADLDRMTRAELDALAVERGVDISRAKNKGDVVAALRGDDALREDGPTIAEFVSAGYPAANYPPKGYASRSTADEIAEAVKAEDVAKLRAAILADLMKLSDEDLAKTVDIEKIAVVDGDTKDVILGKIADARIAAQG
ncbi:hypothetical protein NKG99_03850 [Mesorhizobium sp. M1409]|uniref:hypothetical protein n=1 Tax=Mesorhizobium sp. M1409 TaxID=2957100 RepID=UPI0033367E89